MEDTISSRLNNSTSGQIFRITYKHRDLEITLLKKKLTKDVAEIEILLDGMIQKLVKTGSGWKFEGLDMDHEFANDIWKAISLRYRLW